MRTTKTKLGNGEIRGIVDSVLSEGLSTYFEENPATARAIVEKCVSAGARAKRAKQEADAAQIGAGDLVSPNN